MKKLLPLLILTVFFAFKRTYATTWDEPWADAVIKGASSFILAKVVACDEIKGISLHIIKTLGGEELKDSLVITGFYLLDLCSSSGEGPEFHVGKWDSCYFFINKGKDGKYSIATPTTGFDYLYKGSVAATYRHSYHRALVPVPVYEMTMTAIFNNYHNLPYDKDPINTFVNKYLSQQPARLSENEMNTLYLQHVALECVHHLKLNVNESLILPFLNDKNNFHNQVSGARAMIVCNSDTGKQALVKIIADTSQIHFVQVMCIWTLATFKPVELRSKLEQLEANASSEEVEFGGDIMDPRVCTNIPSAKKALKTLVSEL